MSFLLRFLPSFAPGLQVLFNPCLFMAFVLSTAAVATFAGIQGHKVGMNEHYKYLANMAVETVRFVTKIKTLTETIRVPHIQREVEIQVVYKYLDREIDNVPTRTACNVTSGWLHVHDAAAEGRDRRIERAVDAATDTGITETQALRTITGNYQSYHQVANDLTACRAFVNGLARITAPE